MLGGYNIRQLDPVWFRKHIGLVSQEPVLFATSIADNISYGRDDATQSEVCVVSKPSPPQFSALLTTFQLESSTTCKS